MLVFAILFVLFAVLVIIFSFPKFSPIPYFPSNKKDLKLILRELNLRNGQTVVDLGAGDGIIIFEAARESYRKKINTQFIAVELNPVLVLILHVRRLFHPNRKRIKVVWNDIFKMKYKQFKSPTFYLYISPWFMERVYKKILKDITKFDLVAYFYPVPKVKPNRTIQARNNIYIYKR